VNREAVDALVVKVDVPPLPASLLDPGAPATPRAK
jgi:hypothetical protein